MINKDRIIKTLSFINIHRTIKALFILIIKWVENIESSLSSKADLVDGKVPADQLPDISGEDIIDLTEITSIDDELSNKLQNASSIKVNKVIYNRTNNTYGGVIFFTALEENRMQSVISYNIATKTISNTAYSTSCIIKDVISSDNSIDPYRIFTKEFLDEYDLRLLINDIKINYITKNRTIYPVIILSCGNELSNANSEFPVETIDCKYAIWFTLNGMLYFAVIDNNNNFNIIKEESVCTFFNVIFE